MLVVEAVVVAGVLVVALAAGSGSGSDSGCGNNKSTLNYNKQ